MVRSLVLLSLLIVIYTAEIKINGCTCDEVLNQKECDDYHPGDMNCDWNEQKNVCEADERISCSMIEGSESCRVQSTCGWVSGKCVDFKQCSDYKETVDQKCNNINFKCILLEDDKCGTEKPLECESFAVENCKYTSNNICVLSGTPAACVTMKTCSDGSYNSDQCKKNMKCFWDTDKCRDKKCSDIQAKDSCKFIFSPFSPYATLCHWSADNKCIDGEDEHYTAETCFQQSAFSKVWKDGKCRSCTDSPAPGYSNVLSVFMILFAIIVM
ncbi:unnamed protein product [Paramecium octaurelia]|uniref:Uncharacterized protein n=1 Tax=Paramecium octaurelia TaxID=43137 RepID=A0A8S1YDX2_PAROT|nr:unnamed protein product [Paramecium octaurelia]